MVKGEKLNTPTPFIYHTRGTYLKSSMYEGLFKELKKEHAEACVISSMRGTPIAWYGLEKKKIDVFSTLSAAVYGASVVLHRESGIKSPDIVISDSKDSFLLIKGIDDSTVLTVVGKGDRDKFSRDIDRTIKKFRGVGI